MASIALRNIGCNDYLAYRTIFTSVASRFGISVRYFCSVSVGIFSVFYQPIPKENSVRIFWYYVFGGNIPIDDPMGVPLVPPHTKVTLMTKKN